MRKVKRAWFDKIRQNRVARLYRDLDNYLKVMEVRVGEPSGIRKALVLSPHPDDESIACGGTLALLALQGVNVDVVFLTAGSASGDHVSRDKRSGEARDAAKVLGLKSVHVEDGQEGQLHLQPWLASKVREHLLSNQYDVVFCPWPHDGHSDHQATFEILLRALETSGVNPELWLYEVWSPLPANRVVDIDSTLEIKRRAIDCHESQMTNIDYAAKFLALAQYRSLICRPANHAEAFLVVTPDFFRKVERRG